MSNLTANKCHLQCCFWELLKICVIWFCDKILISARTENFFTVRVNITSSAPRFMKPNQLKFLPFLKKNSQNLSQISQKLPKLKQNNPKFKQKSPKINKITTLKNSNKTEAALSTNAKNLFLHFLYVPQRLRKILRFLF